MKKIALVAAIAAAIPALAQADVTLYGSIRVGVDSIKNNSNGFQSTTGVDDFSSRIGFKGTEDLGNGMKAIWQVENGISADGQTFGGSGSNTFANRQSFVGLQSEFGKVRLGYLNDVLYDTEVTDNLASPREDKVHVATPLYEGNDLFGTYGDSRAKNSIRFDSAEFAGFHGTLQYGAGEARNAGGMKSGENWGAILGYKNSGFFGNYAYMTKLNTAGTSNSTVNRLEGGYDDGTLFVTGTYQWTDLYGNGSALFNGATTGIPATGTHELKGSAWAINAAYTFGNLKPWFLYSKRDNAKIDGTTYSSTAASQWALAADYYLSKRTFVELGYGKVKQESAAQAALGWTQSTASTAWTMLRHDF